MKQSNFLSSEVSAKFNPFLELENEVKNGLSIVDFSYLTIEAVVNPQFALYGLGNIQTGRKFSRMKVAALKRAIDSENYKLTGDAIRFGPRDLSTGKRPLFDGRHRLTAISEGEKSVRSIVMFGLPKDLWMYFDTHKPRLAADLIAAKDEGVSNATRIATAARTVWYLERQLVPNWSQVNLSNPEILGTLDRHDGLYHWTQEVMRGPLKMGGVAACVYWLMRTGDDRAEGFVEKLISSRADLKITDPIYVVREKILHDSIRLSRNNKGRADLVWLIFKHWKDFINAVVPTRIAFQKFKVDAFPWPGGAPYINLNGVKNKV